MLDGFVAADTASSSCSPRSPDGVDVRRRRDSLPAGLRPLVAEALGSIGGNAVSTSAMATSLASAALRRTTWSRPVTGACARPAVPAPMTATGTHSPSHSPARRLRLPCGIAGASARSRTASGPRGQPTARIPPLRGRVRSGDVTRLPQALDERASASPSGARPLGTTTRSAGGDSCFLAKEQSWRTAWRARSLLSWTRSSSVGLWLPIRQCPST